MPYINVGAETLDGRAIMTKVTKERMSEAPDSVNFYSTEFLVHMLVSN